MSLFFFIFLLSSTSAIADDVITLDKGQKAPFAGTLLSPKAAAKILVTGESELSKCLATADRDLKLQEAELKFKIKTKEAELVACQLKSEQLLRIKENHIEFLEKRIEKPKWHKDLIFAGGVISGIALTIASAWVLDKAQEN